MVIELTEGQGVDHIFGGPPYFNQRAYSHWEEYESYLKDMRSIISNCHGVLRDGGFAFGTSPMAAALVAAEKSGRRAYLMELNPAYCDQIIRRWEMLTGGKAMLIEGIGARTVEVSI